MTFLEKLDIQMKGQGLNKSKLSQISGVPYTTIDGFYKKGYENAQISTILKIAHALGCSLDYLIEDEPTEKTNSPAPGEGDELSGEADRMVSLLRKLPPEYWKLAVDLVESVLLAVLKNAQVPEETQVSVRPDSGR